MTKTDYSGLESSIIMAKGFNHSKTWTAGQIVEKMEMERMWLELYSNDDFTMKFSLPPPRRREAIEHTRRKLGLS
jgi:hypothetical protein